MKSKSLKYEIRRFKHMYTSKHLRAFVSERDVIERCVYQHNFIRDLYFNEN